MNIVNYTFDTELIGSKNLGTKHHRNSRVANISSKNLATTKEVCNSEHFTTRLPHTLKENEYDLKDSNINKIFTAQWLDDRKCIMGTKCNKLVILDTLTGKYSIQNPLKSHPNSKNIQNHCGIHSISMNPSRTLLATGAEHVNDIGIYSLPSMEPVLVGFNAHKYWIFDIAWLDDDHVVTGAGDNRLALWTVNNNSKSYNKIKSNRINSSSSLNKSDNSESSKSKILNYLDVDGRVDRNYLKRASPASPPIGSRIPVRLNPFQSLVSPSSSFNSFFGLNRLGSTPSANRFNFYNIENYMPNNNNRRSSSLTPRNEPRQEDNSNDQDDNFINNDNITEDEDEEEEEENDRINFDDYLFRYSNGSNLDLSNEENDDEDDDSDDEFGYSSTSSFFNSFSSEVNEDDEEDEDLNDDEKLNTKRRRLNQFGNFKNSQQRIKYKTPTKVIKCKQSKRIRALAFNPKRNEIAAISMNAAFHYFDINRFEQKYTKKLSPLKENVCLTINNDYSIYAVGSASHVQLLDANNARTITYPIFIKKDIGVRSLHFRNNVVSIGTGVGTILFYDVRANKFLFQNDDKIENHLSLQTTGGWIMRNETYYENLSYTNGTDNSHAIYSHSYDPTGSKLLTVGGPLTINLYGHYAGVWQ